MVGRIPFSKYEAALLLDGYLQILAGNKSRKETIKQVSDDLRTMAINNGKEIDDTYRNVNGISFQMNSMESAYRGCPSGIPATKLFIEIVELYKSNNTEYQKILEVAKKMVDNEKTIKEAFVDWLSRKLPPKLLSDTFMYYYPEIERYCLKIKVLHAPLFDTTDTDTLICVIRAVSENFIFRFMHKKQLDKIISAAQFYYTFVKEYLAEKEAHKQLLKKMPPAVEEAKEVKVPVENQKTDDPAADIMIVDFSHIESLAFTKVVAVKYFDEAIASSCSWKDAYTQVIKALYEDYPSVLQSLHSFPGSTRLEFGTSLDSKQMLTPKEATPGFFVETNFNATSIVKKIALLLEMCNVDYENLVIQYEKKSEADASVSVDTEQPVANNAREHGFYDYLRDVVKSAERTCAAYVSNIKSAEKYALQHNYADHELFCDNNDTIIATVKALYEDPDFIKYNKEQHNRFSAAINYLMAYIGAPLPNKAPASEKTSQTEGKAERPPADEGIVTILKEHFEYGFRYGSIRELMRFHLFAEKMGVSIPENDEALKEAVIACGTVIDDKVYCKSESIGDELKSIVEGIFDEGAQVIYFESFMEQQSNWLEKHIITSEELLKEYLQQNILGCSYSKKFMNYGSRRSEKDIVTEEIKRVWGSKQTESVSSLHDKLPYIPLGNISRIISGNNLFVLTAEGEYLYTAKFHITDDEAENILDYVENACEESGFASLADVPLGGIEEENYELSSLAIQNAIYKIVLSGKYHLNGKILTKDNPELDAVTLLKQFIKGRNECTFDEVADKVVELTGSTNRNYAFQALYDDMVRVDVNHFVADQYISFDIEEIDNILSTFIADHFIALRDVTTFALFPVCGQAWNHYLLESYLYKFSKKYTLHVIHFNDKNAGIIAEKGYNKNYKEMLAIALARTLIPLNKESCGRYLCDTGYLAKSKYAMLPDIVEKAAKLREER